MYEIWYTPRIEDEEVVVARFSTEQDAQVEMANIKDKRPIAFPHHYVWNTETKEKIEFKQPWDEFGWWGS